MKKRSIFLNLTLVTVFISQPLLSINNQNIKVVESTSNNASANFKEIKERAIFIDNIEHISQKVYYSIDGLKSEMDLDKFKNLMSLDVVEYFELRKVYDTDLKIKAYKNSSEYAKLYNQMRVLYDKFIGSMFYVNIKFDSFYDLNRRSFPFSSYTIFDFSLGKSSNYIQEDNHLCLSLISNIKLNEEIINHNNETYLKQGYYIPLVNEETALEIENNKNDCSLVFMFKIQKVFVKQSSIAGMFSVDTKFLMCQTERVLIVNNKNDKIYLSLKNTVTKK